MSGCFLPPRTGTPTRVQDSGNRPEGPIVDRVDVEETGVDPLCLCTLVLGTTSDLPHLCFRGDVYLGIDKTDPKGPKSNRRLVYPYAPRHSH